MLSSPRSLTAVSVGELIASAKFRYRNEVALHAGIESLLVYRGVDPASIKREVQLSRRDRIDFVLGTLGIEVKVDGPAPQVWRQLTRYAGHDCITELLLVTTCVRHVAGAPTELNGKPVHIAAIRGGI